MSPAFGSSARVFARRSTAPSRVSSVTVDAGEEEGEAVDSDITPHESECRTVSLKERNRLPPLRYALCGSNVCECMCPSMHTVRDHRSGIWLVAKSLESRSVERLVVPKKGMRPRRRRLVGIGYKPKRLPIRTTIPFP